jgi:hypothetical protein
VVVVGWVRRAHLRARVVTLRLGVGGGRGGGVRLISEAVRMEDERYDITNVRNGQPRKSDTLENW